MVKQWTTSCALFGTIVKEHGSILCRDISRVDWKDRNQVKVFYKVDKVQECIRIVGETAKLIGETLERA
jgi:hypothetical protein